MATDAGDVTIDHKIAQLESRIEAMVHAVSHQREEPDTGAPTAPPSPVWASPPIGASLFETVLAWIIQGYRGFSDEYLSLARFAELSHGCEDLVCFITNAGLVVDINPAYSERSGCSKAQIVGREVVDLVDERYRGNLATAMSRALSEAVEGQPKKLDDIVALRLQGADGSHFSVEAVVVALAGGDDSVFDHNADMAVVMRDLSIHHDLLEALRESRENYDALSETITEAILRINESMEIVFANSAVKATFGFEPKELRGQPFSTLFPESVYARSEPDFRKYFVVDDQDRRRLGMRNTVEILGRHKNRGIAPMEMSFGNSKDIKGRTLTCIMRDITQRKNAERRLRHLAYHDQLTGLGNRDLFEVDMRRLFETPDVFKTGQAALMFLDLDGFKQVNDTIGHDAGDELLVQTAGRLRKTLRESDSVYRFGGDEFVVLLPFIHDRRGASVVANNILGEIRRPFALSGAGNGSATTVSVGVSIGIAVIPEDGASIAIATKAADLAMYSAKEGGKNRFAFYDRGMDQRAHERWQLEQGIRTSLERQEFRMHYQPLVDAEGAVVGLEALLRWSHPTHGEVPPNRFIPIAEETGMIVPLGSWAIETAFRDAVSWSSGGNADPFIAVNLSPRQFDRADLTESLEGVISRTGVDPGRIVLEVTETCVMSAPERSIATLEALKERNPGLRVAIDDFGTGYSSLSYLSRLPADIIKIDSSFVSELFSLNNEKIVQAIINLGHSLGMQIIAEGVETHAQREFFVDTGCYAFQGFHFHRGMPTSEVATLLNGRVLETV